MKNRVKKHDEILDLLDQYGIDSLEYSIGEYQERCVCVIDDFGGYLVFDGENGEWKNAKLVFSPYEVADEIRYRSSNKEFRLSMKSGKRNMRFGLAFK